MPDPTRAPFTILVEPNLEPAHRRMLRAALSSAGLLAHVNPMWCETWEDVQMTRRVLNTRDARFVLSVGRHGLDQWHQWGLIQVGHQHGNMFEHRDALGNKFTIMVIEHPGTLMQRSFIGHEAKASMKRDLTVWTQLLDGYAVDAAMGVCGRCQSTRVKGGGGRMRLAEHWPETLDGAGLCSEHYRTRARIKSKWVHKRVDKSSRAAQIAGQLEGMPGDGTRVMVSKGMDAG